MSSCQEWCNLRSSVLATDSFVNNRNRTPLVGEQLMRKRLTLRAMSINGLRRELRRLLSNLTARDIRSLYWRKFYSSMHASFIVGTVILNCGLRDSPLFVEVITGLNEANAFFALLREDSEEESVEEHSEESAQESSSEEIMLSGSGAGSDHNVNNADQSLNEDDEEVTNIFANGERFAASSPIPDSDDSINYEDQRITPVLIAGGFLDMHDQSTRSNVDMAENVLEEEEEEEQQQQQQDRIWCNVPFDVAPLPHDPSPIHDHEFIVPNDESSSAVDRARVLYDFYYRLHHNRFDLTDYVNERGNLVPTCFNQNSRADNDVNNDILNNEQLGVAIPEHWKSVQWALRARKRRWLLEALNNKNENHALQLPSNELRALLLRASECFRGVSEP